MKCWNCNLEIEDGARICRFCRTDLSVVINPAARPAPSFNRDAAQAENAKLAQTLNEVIAIYGGKPNIPVPGSEAGKLPIAQSEEDAPVIANVSDLYDALLPKTLIVRTQNSTGSGFILPDGTIGTNAHVAKMPPMYVYDIKLGGNDETVYKAVLVARNDKEDVAILRFAGESVPEDLEKRANRLGNSHELRPGEPVFSIGNSEGWGLSYNQFTVKAKTQRLPGDPNHCELIWLNGEIQSGNSGGPIYNRYGEVVGMATFSRNELQDLDVRYENKVVSLEAMLPVAGVGFAVTIETLLDLKKKAEESGAPCLDDKPGDLLEALISLISEMEDED